MRYLIACYRAMTEIGTCLVMKVFPESEGRKAMRGYLEDLETNRMFVVQEELQVPGSRD